jgi:hypothetical protein
MAEDQVLQNACFFAGQADTEILLGALQAKSK